MTVVCGRSGGEPDLGRLQADFLETRRNLALRDFNLTRLIPTHGAELPGRLQSLLDAFAAGQLNVPRTVFPLDQVREAHALLESGNSVGKLILHPQA